MTDLRKLLAANLKTFRKERGMTQEKLAEAAGTATHYIVMIEGGKNFPSTDMIERIAAALGKDSLDLLSCAPLHDDWRERLLKDINRLITQRFAELHGPPLRARD